MLTNLYGPGDNYRPTNSHVLPAMIRRFHEAAEAKAQSVTCWGTGTPLWQFLHADDLGESCVFALEHWQPRPYELHFLNVGMSVDLSISEFAKAVAKAKGFSGTIHLDFSKLDFTHKKQSSIYRISSLGWRARRIPLTEGLNSTVALFREHLKEELVSL